MCECVCVHVPIAAYLVHTLHPDKERKQKEKSGQGRVKWTQLVLSLSSEKEIPPYLSQLHLFTGPTRHPKHVMFEVYVRVFGIIIMHIQQFVVS